MSDRYIFPFLFTVHLSSVFSTQALFWLSFLINNPFLYSKSYNCGQVLVKVPVWFIIPKAFLVCVTDVWLFFNIMVHHCITPFNVNSLCLNSILIHLYTNIKVNNDWEANHMQALYINFPLIVGDFIGGWVWKI